MEDEIWRDIKGYEGLYAVSNKGRVKSLGKVDSLGRRVNEKILIPCKNRYGYLRVCLCRNGKPKWYTVHRLVLSTFNPCDNMKSLQVNHKNEKKDDNRLENLEWCTALYNNTYNDKHKRVGEKKSIPIAQLTLGGKFLKAWKSSMDAAREGGFHRGAINECCKGKRKTHGNYKWMYLSEFLDKYNGIID